jgi:hypothetical protein
LKKNNYYVLQNLLLDKWGAVQTTVRVPARPMIKGTILKVLLVAISFFYSAMLYSQDYKPWLLDNNFVMIFFLFLSVISFLILNEGLFKRKKPLTK